MQNKGLTQVQQEELKHIFPFLSNTELGHHFHVNRRCIAYYGKKLNLSKQTTVLSQIRSAAGIKGNEVRWNR